MTDTPQNEINDSELSNQGTTRLNSGRWWVWLLVAVLIATCTYVWLNRNTAKPAGSSGQEAKTRVLTVPVSAVPAKTGDMGVYVTGLGTVTSLKTVTVKSLVDGQLMSVQFREGDIVGKGKLLAQIDPRPFQVQLTQAEGQLVRDQAQLVNARLDLERYQTLSAEDSIAKQQYDTQKALVHQLEGTVKVDEGLIANAKLQLTYAHITAPLTGRVGLRQVDPGNIIHTTDTNGLVVITQLQPITVLFPIPEDNLPRVLDRLKKGARLQVEAFDREMKEKLDTGYLLTVDNLIDPTTGTVKFKAVFPNSRNQLFPGQFVNARLLVEVIHDSIIVPSAAIQRGPQGTYVYIVKADRTVGIRPVTVGVAEEGNTSVTSGLSQGEQVVVEGTEKLREGSRVELKTENGNAGKRQRR